MTEKSDLFLYFQKYGKDFFFNEENFIHKINLCYMDQTKQTTINTIMHDLSFLFIFLISKSAYIIK